MYTVNVYQQMYANENVYNPAASAHPFQEAYISYETDLDMSYTHVDTSVHTPHSLSHTCTCTHTHTHTLYNRSTDNIKC
jgi:hypothetical protein